MAFAPGIVVPLEITERRIGQITIIGDKYIKNINGKTHTYVTYLCDCGVEKECRLSTIKAGRCISCGCHKAVWGKEVLTTHGLSRHPLFSVWSGMRRRCYDEKNNNYLYYGGRGIAVCNEWDNSFMPFYNWSMENGWKPELTIDRKNTNGNYEPSNCRWVTQLVNARNKRNTKLNLLRARHIRMFHKRKFPVSKIAKMYLVAPSVICGVLYSGNWK